MAYLESRQTMMEELDVLKSIYCEPEEFVIDISGENVKVIKQMKIICPAQACVSIVNMTLSLPTCYPDVPPEVFLNGQCFNKELLTDIRVEVEQNIKNLIGRPMIMDLIMHLQEAVSSLVLSGRISCSSCIKIYQNVNEERHAESMVTKEYPFATAVLQIDHMRSKLSYVKTLNRWAIALDLTGCVLFCNWLILVVLQGSPKDIQEFIHLLRTVNVDVDSRGRSCKERMAKILIEPHCLADSERQKFTTFSEVNLTSFKEIEDLFCKHGLDKLYCKHIQVLRKGKE